MQQKKSKRHCKRGEAERRKAPFSALEALSKGTTGETLTGALFQCANRRGGINSTPKKPLVLAQKRLACMGETYSLPVLICSVAKEVFNGVLDVVEEEMKRFFNQEMNQEMD